MKLNNLNEDQYDDLMGNKPLPDEDQYGGPPAEAEAVARDLNKVEATIHKRIINILDAYGYGQMQIHAIDPHKTSGLEFLDASGPLTRHISMNCDGFTNPHDNNEPAQYISYETQEVWVNEDWCVKLITPIAGGPKKWHIVDWTNQDGPEILLDW